MKICCFDVGGTSIKYGMYEDGKLLRHAETPTEAYLGGQHIPEVLKQVAGQSEGFDAIGISTAGQVDPIEGSIIYANSNIPGYTGTQLKKELEARFHVPVTVENDVNSAAMGEAVFGAGKDYDSFLCLTYGTGVGGAIIQDRKLYHGASFSAGEFGGIITHGSSNLAGTDCFAGSYERSASTTALVAAAGKYDPSLENGKQIFASMNDPEVKAIVDRWIDEIVLGLVTITHIFNPPCIILGGGIMVQPYIIDNIRKRLPARIMSSFAGVQIHPAMLGNTAGLLGICALTEQHTQKILKGDSSL